jgi:hypothetical protein
MVLSKREQIILAVTLIIVGLLVGDRLVFTPIWDKLKDLESKKTELRDKLDAAKRLFREEKSLQAKWKQLKELLPDEGATRNKVPVALEQWAAKWGFKLISTRPDVPINTDKGISQLSFACNGTGPLNSVASFIWEIETSEMPLRILSMQLNSSNSGVTMSVTLNVSAAYPGGTPSKRAASGAEVGGGASETL